MPVNIPDLTSFYRSEGSPIDSLGEGLSLGQNLVQGYLANRLNRMTLAETVKNKAFQKDMAKSLLDMYQKGQGPLAAGQSPFGAMQQGTPAQPQQAPTAQVQAPVAQATPAAPVVKPSVKGLLTEGTYSGTVSPLARNPKKLAANGQVMRSLMIGSPEGVVLIPTMNGTLSDQDAVARYKQTGEHLGIFTTPEAANNYAQSLQKWAAPQTALPAAPQEASQPVAAQEAPAQPGAVPAEQPAVPSAQEASQPPAYSAPSMGSLTDMGRGFGLSKDIIHKYPEQALAYIQQKQAENQTQFKGRIDAMKEAVSAIESGKTPAERAAIAQMFAPTGLVGQDVLSALSKPPSLKPGEVKAVPAGIPGHSVISYLDPNTGEVKTQIVTDADKYSVNEAIADSLSKDPQRRDKGNAFLARWDAHNAKTTQTRVNIQVQGQETRDAAKAARAGSANYSPRAMQIAEGIKAGTIPADLKNMPRQIAGEVSAILANEGFNLTAAQNDLQANRKRLTTMNSTKQMSQRQSIVFANDSLDIVEDLARKWDAGRFPDLNSGNLWMAKKGLYGQKAQEIATNMLNQISDMQSDLAVVYKGGNSPTDQGLKHASQQLQGMWGKKTMLSNIATIRKNLNARMYSLDAVGTAGLSTGKPAATLRGSAPAAKPGAPVKRQAVAPGVYKANKAQFKPMGGWD